MDGWSATPIVAPIRAAMAGSQARSWSGNELCAGRRPAGRPLEARLGLVSCYAGCRDYHDVLKGKIKRWRATFGREAAPR